jgi:hypothetical protein
MLMVRAATIRIALTPSSSIAAFPIRARFACIDVTAEIVARKDEHQFFFTVSGGVLTISPGDIDSRGLPVGLTTVIAPAKKGAGELTIELSHFDDPADKDGTTRSDETDVSVTFPVVVR